MKIESSNLPCDLEWLKGTDPPCAIADNAPTVRIVDLFCGCGGLSLGAMEACRMGGITAEIAKAVDLDRDALEVFRTNFSLDSERAKCAPIQTLFGGTLRRPLTKEEKVLAKSIGKTDLLVAGPPCQGHSDLNNHSRRHDPRNSLYARVARAAEVLRPQAVVIENVAGVMNDRGRVVARVEKVLRSHGYTVKSICIDARDLGVPQHRRRHFLVAFPEKLQSNWEDLPSYQGEPWTVGDVLEGL